MPRSTLHAETFRYYFRCHRADFIIGGAPASQKVLLAGVELVF